MAKFSEKVKALAKEIMDGKKVSDFDSGAALFNYIARREKAFFDCESSVDVLLAGDYLVELWQAHCTDLLNKFKAEQDAPKVRDAFDHTFFVTAIKLIRADKVVGRGTCSDLDECLEDQEIIEMLLEENIHGYVAAVQWARDFELLRAEYATNASSGETDCPLIARYHALKEALANNPIDIKVG